MNYRVRFRREGDAGRARGTSTHEWLEYAIDFGRGTWHGSNIHNGRELAPIVEVWVECNGRRVADVKREPRRWGRGAPEIPTAFPP